MHLAASNGQPVQRERFIRLQEVERIVGLKKSTIYTLMGQNPPAFPRCVQITARHVAWIESQVLAWVHERIAASRQDELPGMGGRGQGGEQ